MPVDGRFTTRCCLSCSIEAVVRGLLCTAKSGHSFGRHADLFAPEGNTHTHPSRVDSPHRAREHRNMPKTSLPSKELRRRAFVQEPNTSSSVHTWEHSFDAHTG